MMEEKTRTPFPVSTRLPPAKILFTAILIVGGVFLLLLGPKLPSPSILEEKGVAKFTSEEDFKTYLQEAEAGYLGGTFAPQMMRMETFDGGLGAAPSVTKTAPERVSQTNVQVQGIDEPDIVKTDGARIYFSSAPSYYYLREESVLPPPGYEIKIINAFPPSSLAKEGAISKTGDLLLSDKILVISSGDKLFGYDISNPKSPSQKWSFAFEDGSSLVSARLYEGKIYLIAKSRIDTYHPCPVPLLKEGVSLTIPCTDIYHSRTSVPTDTTFTALTVDPTGGSVENRVSFVGSSSSSLVYMSKNALYITYTYYGDMVDFLHQFFLEKGQDLVPASLIEQLRRLKTYDISDTAKMVELGIILDRYLSSLDKDEKLRIENELTNRMEEYAKEHMRDLEKTGIVKITLDQLNVATAGTISGRPLNQFSLDEYQNHLRVATTVSGGMLSGIGESANDIYVLNENLTTVGSVKDLGLEERIYSVRFVEDKGYIVTFRQIDPFFVIDLSIPSYPQLKGELKIPGYSSYLHPITKDKIVGIGKEGSQVKISLFDVSFPNNPTEASKYLLSDYWSDILNTHHAFLLDTEHQIFFLPGSKGGYVFSYENDQLKMAKAISVTGAKRAIYINDYLYIVGTSEIVVLSETDWKTVNRLDL